MKLLLNFIFLCLFVLGEGECGYTNVQNALSLSHFGCDSNFLWVVRYADGMHEFPEFVGDSTGGETCVKN